MPFARTALELILPPGTTLYVALLTGEPDLTADVYSEPSDSAYARQGHSGWTWSGADLAVATSALIQFPAIADAEVTVSWWAIFDSAGVGTGNLLVCGPLLKGFGENGAEFVLGVGDQAEFLAGELRIRAEG